MNIRQATPDDATGILGIYRPIVEETANSFELVVPTVSAFTKRIESLIATHEWLVMEESNTVAGYAYASPHRPREAYKFSIETSVYVHPNYHGRGIGKNLYLALFESVRQKDFHCAYAGIALPNDASIALHKSCGFHEIGTFQEIGFKNGAWHDVSWWQRKI
ncbi:MAG: arsinothricin resistance N-acetyltransferase ArsN1 family B [Woeseiaceae bacterium]